MLFEWVIENICKNAVDAMKGEGQISIDLFETDDYLKIHISDTGKGIPKMLSNLFLNLDLLVKNEVGIGPFFNKTHH